MRYKVLQFLVKLDTNYRFTLKRDFSLFLKNWLMLILSTSCTLSKYYNVWKKSLKWITRYKVASFLDKLAWGIFLGKLTIITFVNLLCPIILKGLNLKNPYRESGYVKFCSFGLNWDQIAGFSLLGQRIRRSPALTENLLILYPNTRKNRPLSRLPQQMFILLQ